MIKRFPNNLYNWLQPLLTIGLLAGIFLLLFRGPFIDLNNTDTIRILDSEVNFGDVVKLFLTNTYEVVTKGSIYVKSKDANSDKLKLIENRYDDLFFIIHEGRIKRINMKTVGIDISLYLDNQNDSLVELNHASKEYRVYSFNSQNNQENKVQNNNVNNNLHETYLLLLRYSFSEILPLMPLVEDYRTGKIHPMKRSKNVYTIKWRHSTFTSDEACEVVISLESKNSTFKSISITNTTPPSVLYFDFRSIDSLESYLNIPQDYTKVN